MLKNTEGAIKNGKSKETGNIGCTIRRKTQHNIYWTPIYSNKHKKLPVSLDFPFLIAPSVFFNIYLDRFHCIKERLTFIYSVA
jgi:hypothetical protein